jgi:hypothetical protein
VRACVYRATTLAEIANNREPKKFGELVSRMTSRSIAKGYPHAVCREPGPLVVASAQPAREVIEVDLAPGQDTERRTDARLRIEDNAAAVDSSAARGSGERAVRANRGAYQEKFRTVRWREDLFYVS